MTTEKIRLSREGLYAKVWATPIHRLSKEYGLSDGGLAKLCRRHKIPIPGRGYWRRVETGQKPPRPALPALQRPTRGYIEITHRERLADIIEQELAAAKNTESTPHPVITVEDGGRIRHPSAIRAKRLLAQPRKDERGILYPQARVFCPVKVSRAALPRAFRIFDALLLALEEEGYTLAWPERDDSKLAIAIYNRSLQPILTEIVNQKPHPPTQEERNKQQRYSWATAKRWDFEATGHLKLTLEGEFWIKLRHTWTDGKKQRLDACLGEVLAVLPLFEHVFKKEAEEAGRRAQEEEERRRREAEERQRQAEYARKVELLRKLANSWHEAKLILGFIDALSNASEADSLTAQDRHDFQALAEWAKSHVKNIDPLLHLAKTAKTFKGAP